MLASLPDVSISADSPKMVDSSGPIHKGLLRHHTGLNNPPNLQKRAPYRSAALNPYGNFYSFLNEPKKRELQRDYIDEAVAQNKSAGAASYRINGRSEAKRPAVGQGYKAVVAEEDRGYHQPPGGQPNELQWHGPGAQNEPEAPYYNEPDPQYIHDIKDKKKASPTKSHGRSSSPDSDLELPPTKK